MSDKPDLRVAICTPSTGVLPSGYAWSLAEMIRCFLRSEITDGDTGRPLTKDIATVIVTGSILPDQRHRCVVEAIRDPFDATHVLWLDSDMKVPHDAIQALLRRSLPVVGANYVRTDGTRAPTAYRDDDEFVGDVFTREDSAGLEEVSHLGLGCCLVDARVFDAIDLPYFAFEPVDNGVRSRGEDVGFMRKLRDAGIRCFVDHDLSQHVRHIGWFDWSNSMGARQDEIRTSLIRQRQEDSHAEMMAKTREVAEFMRAVR